MDDFATVIWVVIIAGAMIFNVVSQSRKARGKGARTPGHEEAWPSQAHPESEPAPMPAPRPAPWPVAPVFPDECQSLKEIPAEEYAPEHTTPKAAGRGHLRHQTVNRLMDDSGNDESPRIPSQTMHRMRQQRPRPKNSTSGRRLSTRKY